MTLINTTKKHWVNGYQERAGGKHKTLAISLGNYALMICWGKRCYHGLEIYLYKLI